MRTMRIAIALGMMVFLSSCAMWRGMMPAPSVPGEAETVVERVGAPSTQPKPLADGYARITVVAEDAVPASRITDDGRVLGVVEPGKPLEWDRPGGVAELRAHPVEKKEDSVRFIGLFLSGEHEVLLGPDDDGTLTFRGGKVTKLSDVRHVARLNRRAQRLPRDAALAYLSERLFAAPAPGRVRSAYADADQTIRNEASGPLLTWSRFDAAGLGVYKASAAGQHGRQRSMKHAFADFDDAYIRMGVTVRISFLRNARDARPVRTFFRLQGDGPISAETESLLIALLACCPNVH